MLEDLNPATMWDTQKILTSFWLKHDCHSHWRNMNTHTPLHRSRERPPTHRFIPKVLRGWELHWLQGPKYLSCFLEYSIRGSYKLGSRAEVGLELRHLDTGCMSNAHFNNFWVKGQIINIFSFAVSMNFVTCLQICHCTADTETRQEIIFPRAIWSHKIIKLKIKAYHGLVNLKSCQKE